VSSQERCYFRHLLTLTFSPYPSANHRTPPQAESIPFALTLHPSSFLRSHVFSFFPRTPCIVLVDLLHPRTVHICCPTTRLLIYLR
jgi:hypothetical protein